MYNVQEVDIFHISEISFTFKFPDTQYQDLFQDWSSLIIINVENYLSLNVQTEIDKISRLKKRDVNTFKNKTSKFGL